MPLLLADTRDVRLQAHVPNQLGFLLLHSYLRASNGVREGILPGGSTERGVGISLDSIHAVIALNTDAGAFKANDLKIPLHFAKDLAHVEAVLQIHPEGVLNQDRNGRTPLHAFLSELDAYSKAGGKGRVGEGDVTSICSLLSLSGGSHAGVLTTRDKEGMTPLHHAISSSTLPSSVLLHLFNLCRRSSLISVQNASTRELVRLQKALHNPGSGGQSPGAGQRSPIDVVIAMQTTSLDADLEEADREGLFGVTVLELMMHSQKQDPAYYDDVIAAVVDTYPFLSQIKTRRLGGGRTEQLFYPLYVAVQAGCSAAVAGALLLHLPYRSAREKCGLTGLTAAHLCVIANNAPVLSVVLREDPLLSLLYSLKVAAIKHRAFPCLRLLLRCHIMVMKVKAKKLLVDIETRVQQQEQQAEAGDAHADILSLPDDVLVAIDEDDSSEYHGNDGVNNVSAAKDFSVVSNVSNVASYEQQVLADLREDHRLVNRFQSLLFSAIVYKVPPDSLALLLELYVECNIYQQDLEARLAAPGNLCVVVAPPLHAVFQVHSGDAEAVESLVYVLTRALPGTAAVVDYYGDSALHIAVQRYPLSHRLFQYLLLACPRLGVTRDLKGKLAIEYFPGLFEEKPAPAGEGSTFLTGSGAEKLEEQQLPLAALLLYCLPVASSGRGEHTAAQHGFVWTHVLAECADRYSGAVKCILQNFPEPRLLAFCEDAKGHCYAIDIATPACKRHLLASIYFLGAYGFRSLLASAPPAARQQQLVADVHMSQHLLRFADRFDDEGGRSRQCSLAALLFYHCVDSYVFDKRAAGKLLGGNPPSAQAGPGGEAHHRMLDLLRRRGQLVASHSSADDPYFYSECRKTKYGLDAESYPYCNVFVFESSAAAAEFHGIVSALESKHQYYIANNLYHNGSPSPPARSPSKQALLSPSSSAGRLQSSRPSSSAAARPSSAAQSRPPAASRDAGSAQLPVIVPPRRPASRAPSRAASRAAVSSRLSRARAASGAAVAPQPARAVGSSDAAGSCGADEVLAIIKANTNLDP